MIADKQMFAHAIIGAGVINIPRSMISLLDRDGVIVKEYDREGMTLRWVYGELVKLDEETLEYLYSAARGQ